MIIDFSAIGVLKEQPVLILKNADGTPIQTLGYAFNLKADIRYNEVSTITFDLPAYVDGKMTPHYNDVAGMRIVEMIGWGQFILVNPKTSNDGVREIKNCKAYSLEYELTYKNMYIPPMDDAPIDLNGIRDMILEDAPSWDIVIPADLLGKYRTLSEENTNVYNFIKSTVQKTFGCIFDFDTYHRRMIVRSVDDATVTEPVHISLSNLAKQIEIEEDTEHIVTVLDVNGGENVDILMVNPIGTNKIYNLDYFMNETYFSPDLIRKWNAWKAKLESARETYYNTSIRLALKTSSILTQEAKKREMEGAELGTLENERTVYIELMAQLRDKNRTDYRNAAANLAGVNTKIERKKREIAHQDELIEALETERDNLESELSAIKNQVAFTNTDNFTAEDLASLRLYFKDDSIEETSFVLSDVDAYDDNGIGGSIGNVVVRFSGGTVNRATDANNMELYTITGGTMSCALTETITLTAAVVTANIERDARGYRDCVISAYLGSGIIGDTAFPSASISITGGNGSVRTHIDASGARFTEIAVHDHNSFYFTRNTTDYERYAVEWSLYNYGVDCLNALAYPSYTFSVSLANFFALEDFRTFANAIKLGERVYLNTGNEILEPICIGASIDFENMASLTLLFGDKYSASDKAFKLVDLLDNSITMGKTLSSNKLSYSSFVNSGASSAVKDFMQSALDVAKNKVLSSTGQGISWDETGLHLRKYKNPDDPDEGFENEQIWGTNNALVFTDDGWQTAKMAIGKIVDESINRYVVTSDTSFNPQKTYYRQVSAGGGIRYEEWTGGASDWANRPTLYELDHSGYGIAAPYIVGTLLAGQNLVIANENGAFRVDGNGVWIDSLNFYITRGSHNNQTLNSAFAALQQGTSDLSDQMHDMEDDLIKKINETSTTYYQDTPPADPNIGDLWFNTADVIRTVDGVPYNPKKLYRYTEDYEDVGTTPWLHWTLVEDAGVQQAIDAASAAQTTADSKVETYFQTDLPSRSWSAADRIKHIGDLWYHTGLWELLYFDNKGSYRGFLGWRKLEDNDALIARSIASTQKTRLDNIIKENGYLDSGKLDGVINAQVANMKSATGNVLFDGDGLWLMDSTSKDTATQAVWINENGIMIGKGNPGDPTEWKDSQGNSAWKTAISFDGIIADALASKVLSSQEIYGLEIKIGGTADKPNFHVTSDGTLKAKSGEFDGDIYASNLKGSLTAEGDDAWLIGAGLSIGGNASKNGGNFYVDQSGNVTMKGGLNLSDISSINWGDHPPNDCEFSPDGSTDWSKTMRSTDNYRRDWSHTTKSYGAPYLFRGRNGDPGTSPTLPGYIESTSINLTRVASPRLFGGAIYATGIGSESGDNPAYYICNGVENAGQEGAEPNKPLGWISYDTNGAGVDSEAKNRVFFHTNETIPIKIESGGSMSIGAGSGSGNTFDKNGGTVHMLSDMRLYSRFILNGNYCYGDDAPEEHFRYASVFTGQIYFEY